MAKPVQFVGGPARIEPGTTNTSQQRLENAAQKTLISLNAIARYLPRWRLQERASDHASLAQAHCADLTTAWASRHNLIPSGPYSTDVLSCKTQLGKVIVTRGRRFRQNIVTP